MLGRSKKLESKETEVRSKTTNASLSMSPLRQFGGQASNLAILQSLNYSIVRYWKTQKNEFITGNRGAEK